ncbi:hypothetical protein COLO4_20957 [Corchorus olitorius]|uniref:Myb/SANT-like domain-containing protein n=1 Tax=Corchorus olitorius TaxID=93759 RepID=A0A1R3IVX6_9ROSI|nr:hypothetical protein COLO4_20957 [Corchorus olitorius]
MPPKTQQPASQRKARVVEHPGSKHVWTPDKDVVLVSLLVDISNDSKWRADNGTFRTGYLTELERRMQERIPGCQVKGQPHISSRIKLWKRQYGEILVMMGDKGSGLGWNEKDKCIRRENDVWESWLQGHPQAKVIRGKTFPYLHEWGVIFGKDRATGEHAEGPADVDDDLRLDDEAVPLGEDGETNYYEAPEVAAEEDEEEGDEGESSQPPQTQLPQPKLSTLNPQMCTHRELGSRRGGGHSLTKWGMQLRVTPVSPTLTMSWRGPPIALKTLPIASNSLHINMNLGKGCSPRSRKLKDLVEL